MTNKQIENRVRKLQELEAQQAALTAQADAIRSEIKAELDDRKVDEVSTGSFTVRWKYIFSDRLDTKALKKERPEVAAMFTRTTMAKRFSIV